MTEVTVTEVWALASAAMAGLLLGGFFFGGLWWTIQKGVASNWPAVWFAGSLLLRVSVILAGFYYLVGDRAERLLLGLVGFFIARLVVTRLARPSGENGNGPGVEASHAPQS